MRGKLKKYLKRRLPPKLITAFNRIKMGLLRPMRPVRDKIRYGCPDMFDFIGIETITACNRRCSYCPNSKFDRGLIANTRTMEAGLFYNIIDQLSELKWTGDIIPSFYCEPLLDTRLPVFLRYIREKLPSSMINLFTNGDLLTVGLYEELIKGGSIEITVTPHSGELPANVRAVLDLRGKSGDGNVRLICRELEYISSKGGMIEVKDGVKRDSCVWPGRYPVINHAGDVIFCCDDYHNDVKLGNAGNERLLDIWKKPEYVKMRRQVRRGVYELELCRKCMIGKPPGPASAGLPAASDC